MRAKRVIEEGQTILENISAMVERQGKLKETKAAQQLLQLQRTRIEEAQKLLKESPDVIKFMEQLITIARDMGYRFSCNFIRVPEESLVAQRPRRFNKVISIEELCKKILLAYKKHRDCDDDLDIDLKDSSLVKQISDLDYSLHLTDLTPQVCADIRAKVDFDSENVNVIAIDKLENGLATVWIEAGGDWETPVTFFIYYDGKKLRAYVPTDGNTWNTDTSQAYGNEDEADELNFQKRFSRSYSQDIETPYDIKLMIAEALKEIEDKTKK